MEGLRSSKKSRDYCQATAVTVCGIPAYRPLSVVGQGESRVQSHPDSGGVGSIPVILQRAFFACHERFSEASLPGIPAWYPHCSVSVILWRIAARYSSGRLATAARLLLSPSRKQILDISARPKQLRRSPPPPCGTGHRFCLTHAGAARPGRTARTCRSVEPAGAEFASSRPVRPR